MRNINFTVNRIMERLISHRFWITLKTGIVASGFFILLLGIAFAELVSKHKGQSEGIMGWTADTSDWYCSPTVAGYILLRIFSTRRSHMEVIL